MVSGRRVGLRTLPRFPFCRLIGTDTLVNDYMYCMITVMIVSTMSQETLLQDSNDLVQGLNPALYIEQKPESLMYSAESPLWEAASSLTTSVQM